MIRSRAFRRLRSLAVSVLVAGSLTACSAPPPDNFAGANLILISIDTLRADHLSCYGYERPTSPFLDKLAGESVLFENVIAQSTWTTPSHAALFTSRYPTELGIRAWPDPGRIPDQFPTVPEILLEAGILGYAFTESAWMDGSLGFERGFQLYDDRGGRLRRILPRAVQALPHFDSSQFFLFLHTYDVHSYDPLYRDLRDFQRPYRGKLKPGRELAQNIQRGDNREWREALSPQDLAYIIDLYDASIREVDTYLQSLVDTLKSRGLYDNTILAITADHGEEFLDHGKTGHGYSAYDHQIHVPWLLRLPGGAYGGTRVRAQVRSIDIVPTLLDLLEIDHADRDFRGRSVASFFRGAPQEIPAFVDRGHAPKVCVRTLDWKVIFDTERDLYEAYRIATDPGERDNVIGDEAQGPPAELTDALDAWRSSLVPPEEEPISVPLSERQRAALENLGYVTDKEADESGDDASEQKDR